MKSTIATVVERLCVLACLTPAAVLAQGKQAIPQGRIAVRVALVTSFDFGNAGALIVRRGGNDMIVLPAASATAQNLAVAAATLEVLMDQYGDVPKTDGLYRVRDGQTAPARLVATTSKVLASMSGEPMGEVAGFGRAQVTQVFLRGHDLREHEKAIGKLKIAVGQRSGAN
jgi:hypothetical protein